MISTMGWAWGAMVLGFGSGLSLYGFSRWEARRREQRLRVRGQEADSSGTAASSALSLMDRVIELLERTTRSLIISKRSIPPWLTAWGAKPLQAHASQAGLHGSVTPAGFAYTRMRLSMGGGILGFCCGAVLSFELGILMLFGGAIVGWMLPKWTLKQRVEHRTAELEAHLPEMLDVIALAMRSGLSFDGSVRLYAGHFDTMLARELTLTQRQWSSGLERRDEALRKLSASYDSPLFERLVETLVRSLRFGSSMVASLEEDAREARSVYRAQREERIAKAPVKMMIPTGTLILPAMLIMVLGPVLLELIGGAW